MTDKSYAKQIEKHLDSITVDTWFDIGYFLDKLRIAQPIRKAAQDEDTSHIAHHRNVAFLTYGLGRDDVSQEMLKTAKIWRELSDTKTTIHWLVGRVESSVKESLGRYDVVNERPLMQGFEAWGEPYELLFHTKLNKSDANYLELPLRIWADAKAICYDLMRYIEAHDIELIVAANVASNPGNISLTMALAVLSELYNITIVSTNHDFYWEGISHHRSRKKNAPRDHFFKNADLDVMFSTIQALYPWNSTKWLHVNRHIQQSNKLIDELGFNPFNVTEISSIAPKLSRSKIPTKRPSTEAELKECFSEVLAKIQIIRLGSVQERKLAAKALRYVLDAPRDQESPLIFQKHRTYIPGILQLRFLSQVKSYANPTHFRIEEKQTMSRVFAYAQQLIPAQATQDQKDVFYRSISSLLSASKGKYDIEFDTTFDYRYRNSTIYLWRELTELGVLGAVTHLADTVFDRIEEVIPPYQLINLMTYALHDVKLIKELTNNLAGALTLDFELESLANYKTSAIKALRDQVTEALQRPMIVGDTKFFKQRILERPQSLVILPGSKNTVFWQLVALDQLAARWRTKGGAYQFTFVCREHVYGNDLTMSELSDILKSNIFPFLKLAFDADRLKIIPLGSRSSAIDLLQISPQLKEALLELKENGGHVLAKGEQNYFSLDMLDIHSFRYGTLHSIQAKAVFDAVYNPGDPAFLQFVPAGLRTFFAFPLTVETPAEFSKALNGLKLTPELLEDLKIYLDKHGMSLTDAIEAMKLTDTPQEVSTKRLSGKYSDGYSWTGVAVKMKPNVLKHGSSVITSKTNKTLPQFVKAFERRTREKVVMGWNGGYILNLEIVGKLKISYDLIGTPLGLIISKGEVLCLPLFNRPAFAFKKNGEAMIEEIKLDFPGRIIHNKQTVIEWAARDINPAEVSEDRIAVYTPYSGLDEISVSDRIIVVLGGQQIISVSYPEDHQAPKMPLFAAGVTFSLPSWMRGQVAALKPFTDIRLDVDLPHPWNDVTEAMEAGPLIIKDGKYQLDIEKGGWLLKHSMSTQATRRDRENERWPLIGCGITKSGEIISVVVESRIRESVGATHAELADILLAQGAVAAMEFDSGGSASLFTEEGMVNIVPYTSTFNVLPYTGRSEARPVSNAVLIHTKRY